MAVFLAEVKRPLKEQVSARIHFENAPIDSKNGESKGDKHTAPGQNTFVLPPA